jgi:hypothetical protein
MHHHFYISGPHKVEGDLISLGRPSRSQIIPFGVQFNIGLQHGAEARARLDCLY